MLVHSTPIRQLNTSGHPTFDLNASYIPSSTKLLSGNQKSFLAFKDKDLSHSQHHLIPKQQSEKLPKKKTEGLPYMPQSLKNFPDKQICLKRSTQNRPVQSSFLTPIKKRVELTDLLTASTPEGKERESFSTQSQSPKDWKAKINDYHLIRPIGEGRFGGVFLAVHTKTGFVGAMKILKKSGIAEYPISKRNKIKSQIISEIKLQSFFQHPNLVQLYDCFADYEHIYLFLQLGTQGHLFSLLEQGPFSEEATSIVVREVARGIAHMHAHGVLHRDLKLENIVLTHGMAKICDFGWAVHEPNELRSTLCGTPLYLAPEALCGEQYNSKVDIWALGTLAHQLYTAQNPFCILTRKHLHKIITHEPVLTSGSPEIRSFINFLLKKNPQRRPDADIILRHPFIQKYQEIETSQEICCAYYRK